MFIFCRVKFGKDQRNTNSGNPDDFYRELYTEVDPVGIFGRMTLSDLTDTAGVITFRTYFFMVKSMKSEQKWFLLARK